MPPPPPPPPRCSGGCSPGGPGQSAGPGRGRRRSHGLPPRHLPWPGPSHLPVKLLLLHHLRGERRCRGRQPPRCRKHCSAPGVWPAWSTCDQPVSSRPRLLHATIVVPMTTGWRWWHISPCVPCSAPFPSNGPLILLCIPQAGCARV